MVTLESLIDLRRILEKRREYVNPQRVEHSHHRHHCHLAHILDGLEVPMDPALAPRYLDDRRATHDTVADGAQLLPETARGR